jgi:hypothetical protein
MTLYVILHEDRHLDPQVYVFASVEAATEKYKEIVADYPDAKEQESPPEWLLFHELTGEGDSIRLEETTLLL